MCVCACDDVALLRLRHSNPIGFGVHLYGIQPPINFFFSFFHPFSLSFYLPHSFSLSSFPSLPLPHPLPLCLPLLQRSEGRGLPRATRIGESSRGVVLGLVAMACVGGILVVALGVACFRYHGRQLEERKLGLGPEGGAETHFDYQVNTSLRDLPHTHTHAHTRTHTHTLLTPAVCHEAHDDPQGLICLQQPVSQNGVNIQSS